MKTHYAKDFIDAYRELAKSPDINDLSGRIALDERINVSEQGLDVLRYCEIHARLSRYDFTQCRT